MAEKSEQRGIRNFLREASSRLLTGQGKPESRTKPEFRVWLESYPIPAASLQTWSPAAMIKLINWASQARWVYSEQLHSLLAFYDSQQTLWLDTVHKIARYHSAIKSMVKLAVKQPGVLAGIQIQEVRPHPPRQFSVFNDKAPLLAAIKKLVGEDSGMIMEQLETRLGTQDAEAKLRKACLRNLTLHAEMQLVLFYEGNPTLTPRIPFIGTSKKACFLCHEYLLQHPLRLQASACHQKIYPSWMPPPYYPIAGKFKSTPFVKLSKRIEQLTKRELKTALNAPRRPKNQDSTAGPPLTTTATRPTGSVSEQSGRRKFTRKDGSLSGDYD